MIGEHPVLGSTIAENYAVYLETEQGNGNLYRAEWLGEFYVAEDGFNQFSIPHVQLGIVLSYAPGRQGQITHDYQVFHQGQLKNIWDTLLEDRRIQIRAERGYGDDLLIFDGFTKRLDINWNATPGQSARKAAVICVGIFNIADKQERNIIGQYRRTGTAQKVLLDWQEIPDEDGQPGDPPTGNQNEVILVEPLQTIFNPAGNPNCDQDPLQSFDPISGKNIHVYVFSDHYNPDSVQIPNDWQGIKRPVYWNWARILAYIWFQSVQPYRVYNTNDPKLDNSYTTFGQSFIGEEFPTWGRYELTAGNLVDMLLLKIDQTNTVLDADLEYDGPVNDPDLLRRTLRTRPSNFSLSNVTCMEAFTRVCAESGLFYKTESYVEGGTTKHRLVFRSPVGYHSANVHDWPGSTEAGTEVFGGGY